jgi:hypothetical protein
MMITGILGAVLYLAVILLVLYFFWWAIGYFGIVDPFAKVLRFILLLIMLIVVVNFLLGLGGHSFINYGYPR